MGIKSAPEQITYVRPEWKIWHSFFIMLLVLMIAFLLSFFEESVQQPLGLLLLVNVLQFACFFLIPLFVCGVVYRQPPAALGIPARPLARGLGKAILWGFMLYSLNVLSAGILLVFFPAQPQEMQTMMQAMLQELNGIELGALIFCVVVLAPVGEEIFFRAFLFGAAEARLGQLAAIIISAAVFAVVHESLWNFLPMFVGGCGFALLYAKYRDITLNIVAHAVWNSIAVMLMFAFLK